jgi:excisionase family DNA binding protein
MAAPKQEHRPPINVAATAVYIGSSERHVRRLVAERRIPFVKVGGSKVRFFPSDLDAWLAANRIEAVR